MDKRLVASLLIVLISLAVLFAIGQQLPILLKHEILPGLVVGPEGPTCSFYAVEASGALQHAATTIILDKNLNVMSAIGHVTPGSWIAYRDESFGWLGTDRYGYKWISPDAKNPVFFAGVEYFDGSRSGIDLEVRIWKPSVQEVDTHGNPGGWSPSRMEWFSYDVEYTETTSEVRLKRYGCYIVPIDFVIELSIRPDSGEKWGAFQDFHMWFVLDTIVWINAYTQSQLPDRNPPPGAALSAYNFRGAFPIWAWVGAWEPFVVKNERGDQLASYPSDLDEYLRIWPSFAGSEVSLYRQPGWTYDWIFAESIIRDPNLLKNRLGGMISNLPDPRFAQTVFFHVDLVKYGALKQWGGWWIWYWENYYYPTSQLRIRALYALWGEWIYLWTKEEAEKQGYRPQNRTSVIDMDESEWDNFVRRISDWWGSVTSGIQKWLSNPLTVLSLWAIFVIIVIIVVIVVTGPSFLKKGSRTAN
ncbi:MAG: hypothetical protein QXU81_00125 [Candidatus Bathyarchaeia archaeon]